MLEMPVWKQLTCPMLFVETTDKKNNGSQKNWKTWLKFVVRFLQYFYCLFFNDTSLICVPITTVKTYFPLSTSPSPKQQERCLRFVPFSGLFYNQLNQVTFHRYKGLDHLTKYEY
ncbi:hypothetical protein CHARACLAT_008277 [Characodon lateralis]|uniref:Uncharacterized protein n=1 Tax=Characodon lateralis TaxID=208331 RepID=A0ABU7ES43_9TELE|nr:hypothetical protein [Characodon lateralis]